jgi:hypothetical protein
LPLTILAIPSNQEQEYNMSETVTATYDSKDAMQNAVNELVGAGIPNENYHIDESALQIKVIIPKTSKPEILELLNKHSTKKDAS